MDMNIYKHDPLDSTERSLRLLRLKGGTEQEIQCELIPTSFGNNQLQYEAVSYTWGPDFKSATININGKRLPITFNLHLILHDLRSSKTDRILWIDAICINQRDDLEKGHQVQQMSEIYSSAERVLFCVGRPTELTDLLMDSLRELQGKLQKLNLEESSIKTSWEEVQLQMADNHFIPVFEQLEALTCIQRRGLEYILTQDWFQRVWILQEVANARDALVYCGSKSVSATTFVKGIRLLGLTHENHMQSFETVEHVLKLMPGPLNRYQGGMESRDLYSILRQFRYAKATDERDKIFALFGLCTDTQSKGFPKADYTKSAKETIRDAVSYMCHCDLRDTVNVPYATISDFLQRLDSIEDIIFRQLWDSSDMTNARSLLQHSRGLINVTLKMIQKAADNTMQENGIMELLVQQPSAKTVLLSTAEHGWTPLWWAARNGHETLVRLLMERGADFKAKNEDQYMPLHLAVENGHEAVTKLLLEEGADIDAKGFEMTPLHLATRNGHEAIIKMLLERGANTNAKNEDNYTPLHLAVWNGLEAIARLLLEKGADIDAKTFKGTPLLLATENGCEATVKLLIEKGADLEAQDDFNETPLHTSAFWGHEAIMRLLLEKGANIEAECDQRTALHYASASGKEATTRLLLDKGANFKTQDSYGRTPLQLAAQYEHEAVVSLLERAEASAEMNTDTACSAEQEQSSSRDIYRAIEGLFEIG
ncbi:ankyrin repeat-containing domain protein [Xylaria flabelliformis]|nr:ankyrin repeat-containing domain protein [Xylaria flabelliformis]